ncbi:39S ribosomal protein L54, mitochondrial [Frankliniella fusca]|uniref:Large ribosomal subunit protein mL54 n=1 Tax=Frankliniella fusca TaxID=407009 RepID=A0AAE1LNW0_9NEOP|nr:39S ribosomal protein L54, mitochondrial [Frankliniella fusca]
MNSSSLLLSSKGSSLLFLASRPYAVKAVKASNPAIAGLGKKSKDKAGASKKIKLEVEKDPNKLVNYLCGSNLMQTGEDIKLKPDSEYPDWLWNVYTGPVKQLEDYEPGSKEYLELLKRINIRKNLKLIAMNPIKPQ